MIVLGIESSCDETAAAIVENGNTLLANVVATSMDLHAAFGGVIPEIAARSHVESIMPVIEAALKGLRRKMEDERLDSLQGSGAQSPIPNPQSLDPWDAVDAIAVTYGAGLGGSLLVGVMTAKTLAITKKKPLYAVNHVEAHVYANFLTETSLPNYQLPSTPPQFPLLALIVSGGHSQLVLFRDHFDYTLLGQTRDDAIGEAFDKVAKIIGLPYPGGPSIAQAAKLGDAYKYKFPKAKLDHKYEYSFSGPKTAVLRLAQELIGENYTFPSFKLASRLSVAQKNDIAASFQRIAVETVVDKTVMAFEEFQPKSVVIAGGVAANQELRRQLSDRIPIPIQYTDPKLCTDNGAMIATLGWFKMQQNQPVADPYTLHIEPNLSM